MVNAEDKMSKSIGDSAEQREAEGWLLDELSKKLDVTLTKKRIELREGSWLELDGYCESPLVLCEVYAHIGSLRGDQPHKVMTDAFKLVYANKLVGGDGRLILLFADKEAASYFQGKSWMTQCINEFGIEVEIIEPPKELKEKILGAQKRQYR